MHIAVLCQGDSWYFGDLVRAAKAAAAGEDLRLSAVDFSTLEATIDRRQSFRSAECDLLTCDAVLVRTMPPGSLEQVVFRMDLLARLQAAGLVVLNEPKAIEAAVDKYLTTARLHAADIPVPRTVACQGWRQAMQAFASLGGDVVVKPLFGGEGRGMARVTDDATASRTFRLLEQLGAVLYLQEFIPHEGFDIRVLNVGRRAWAARRSNAHDWRTNVSRGATVEPIELTQPMRELAARAAEAVGAEIAGVDLLPDGGGGYYVLEVNAVPGWKGLAAAHRIDIAGEVLQYTAALVNQRRSP